jgi:transcriptional regulator of heat shock response
VKEGVFKGRSKRFFKSVQTKIKCQNKFQRSPSSVPPPSKKEVKQVSKESLKCVQTKKIGQKNIKQVPQTSSKQKKVAKKSFKEVLQVCQNKQKKCQKKGSNLISHPNFRFDPQFQGFTHVMSQGLLLYDNYCSFIDEISSKVKFKNEKILEV